MIVRVKALKLLLAIKAEYRDHSDDHENTANRATNFYFFAERPCYRGTFCYH